MDEWVWSNGGMTVTGETEVLGEKPVSFTLCTTNPTWDRTNASAIEGRQLTAKHHSK